MKAVELQEKTIEELNSLLCDLTKELVNLRMQKAVGQLSAPHRLRLVRRNIARVKTLLTSLKVSNDTTQLESGEVA